MIWIIRNLWQMLFPRKERTGDRRLDRILREFDCRAMTESPLDAHAAWLASPKGKEEVALLVSGYEKIPYFPRREMLIGLIGTGSVHVLPLVKKAFEDPDNNGAGLAGIEFAISYSKCWRRFGLEVAPFVATAIGRYVSSYDDRALSLLPYLDHELASRIIFNDGYLSPESPFAWIVLSTCTDAGLAVPLPLLKRLLEIWEPDERPANFRPGSCLFSEAVLALALVDPVRAAEIADSIVRTTPCASFAYEKVPLKAAGLDGLYEALCDVSDEDFQFLPEHAQIYCAVTTFVCEWEETSTYHVLSESTGDLLPLVKKGCQAIGAVERLRYLEWVCQPFGLGGPSPDKEERKRQMESMNPPFYEQVDVLRISWLKTKPESDLDINWLLNRYAARHADVLRPLLQSLQYKRENPEQVT